MNNCQKLIDHIIDIAQEFDAERYAMIKEINELSEKLVIEPKWKEWPTIGESEIVFELKNLKKMLTTQKKDA